MSINSPIDNHEFEEIVETDGFAADGARSYTYSIHDEPAVYRSRGGVKIDHSYHITDCEFNSKAFDAAARAAGMTNDQAVTFFTIYARARNFYISKGAT
jgi:hypothetical protein